MKFKTSLLLFTALGMTIGAIPTAPMLSSITTVSAETVAPKTADEYVQQIHQLVAENWPHMQKAWPTLDYTQHNMVVFYLNENSEPVKAWVINTKEIRELKPDEYKSVTAPNAGGYQQVKFQDQPSIALSFDDQTMSEAKGNNEVYTLATHELVHFYYQPTTKSSSQEDEGGRSQEYPVAIQPRLYRTMIYRNLAKALQEQDATKSEEALQQASYWYHKWKKEYPDEANYIKGTDIDEGHARYIEYLGESIGKKDHEQTLLSKVDNDFLSYRSDLESYELGFVAGSLLDKRQPEWKQTFFDTKKTPVDLLLENVAEKKEDDVSAIETQLNEMVNDLNKNIETAIQNIITAEKDTKIPYLKVDNQYVQGSFQAEGFYQYNGKNIISNLTSSFKVGNHELNINAFSVATAGTATGQELLIPLTDNFKQDGDTLTFDNAHLKGTVKVTKSTDADGREVYTVIK